MAIAPNVLPTQQAVTKPIALKKTSANAPEQTDIPGITRESFAPRIYNAAFTYPWAAAWLMP